MQWNADLTAPLKLMLFRSGGTVARASELGTSDILLGVTLQWTGIPLGGGGGCGEVILIVASCYRTQGRLEFDFTLPYLPL